MQVKSVCSRLKSHAFATGEKNQGRPRTPPFTGLPHRGTLTAAARLSCEGRACGNAGAGRMGIVCPAMPMACWQMLPAAKIKNAIPRLGGCKQAWDVV